jgi:lon-related putative ATP-dependent protease
MGKPIERSELYHHCDPSRLGFETTAELEPLGQIIGQKRALEAVEFGTEIRQDGYNLYAMGPSGSGKHSVISELLEQRAQDEAIPSDWVYVNNFHDSRKPIAIELEPGQALDFKDDVDELLELLKTIIPTIFESNEYRTEKEAINQHYLDEQTGIFTYLQNEADAHGVSMNTTSTTRVTFVPMEDGKVISHDEFETLDDEKKAAIQKRLSAFEKIVKEGLREISRLNKMQQQEFKAFDKKVTTQAVEAIMEDLRQKYQEHEKIVDYFIAFEEDVINHVHDFIAKPEESNLPAFMQDYYAPSFKRYEVNVFISNEEKHSAPVIYEDHPSHQNLIGRIEHTSQMGTLVTDFTMIKPGAVHKANGGYLLLDVRKLLMNPFSWEELKRMLHSKEVRIESLAQQYSLVSTATLEPEPVPINLKVVLIGERLFYYLLYHYDPEFRELFKVSADFENDMPRDEGSIELYAKMIGTIATNDNLLPLSHEAVARVIEHASRHAEHRSKMTTHIRTIADLLKESDYWASKANRETIGKADVEQALKAQDDRISRVQERMYEQIEEGTVKICTSGEAVGQINALTYLALGASRFGMPTRITAKTRIGKGEIIDIERKVELSGPIHSKGVMILSGYLSSRYARETPLSLSASLVFEQTYGMIEGDSASSTELYALLSSLSGLPIKQHFAVTGSVNQNGEIQAIGGVNEKIEGFFDICKRLEPDAKHAVLIPQSNVKHLMLKQEILDAVDAGTFEIYAVNTIDEGITILTGVEAGKADEEGHYPEESVNAKVVARLKSFTDAVLKLRAKGKEEKNGEDDEEEAK